MIGLGGDAISNDVSSLAATGAVAALVVLLGASALAARRLRSPGRSGLAWFAALGSVALVIAVTLLRDGWPTGFDPGRLGEWSRNGWDRLSSDPLGSQIALNVALFVPAGAAWTWLLDRPWRVLAALVAGSFAVELTQAVLGVGAADVADVAANAVGAAIGVGIAVLIRHASRRPAGARRVVGWPVVIAAGAVVLAVGAGLMLGAANRQRSVEDELRQRFTSTTKAEVDAWLGDATGRGADELFSAISVRADGTRTTPDVTELRYPAKFLGLDRCVFVTWTADTVTFRKASGGACSAVLE
jgi:hypothetical protein